MGIAYAPIQLRSDLDRCRKTQAPYVAPIEVHFGSGIVIPVLVLGDEVLHGAIPMEDMDLVITPSKQEVSVNQESPEIPYLKVK